MLVWTIFLTLAVAFQTTLNDEVGVECTYITGSDNSYLQLFRTSDHQEFAAMVFPYDNANKLGFNVGKYITQYSKKKTDSFFGDGGKFLYRTDSAENGPQYNQIVPADLPSITIPIANSGLWCVAVSPLEHPIEVRIRNKWGFLAIWEYQSLPIFWAKWVMYTFGLFAMLNAQRFYPKPSMISYEVIKSIVIPAWLGTAVLISELHLRNAYIDSFLVTPWLSDMEWLCQQLFSSWVRYAVWLVCLGWGTLSMTTDIPGAFTAKLLTVLQAFLYLVESPWMYKIEQLRGVMVKFDGIAIKGYNLWYVLDILKALMSTVAALLMIKAYVITRTKEVTPNVDAGTAVSFNLSVVLVAVPVIKEVISLFETITSYSVTNWYVELISDHSAGQLTFSVLHFLWEEIPVMISLVAVYLLWVRPNRGLLATNSMK